MTAVGWRSSAFRAQSCQVIRQARAATAAVCLRTPLRPRHIHLHQTHVCNKRVTCHAADKGSGGRQFETEFFRKLFGTPPEPKPDNAGGGGGDDPPGASQFVDEEEEPDEEQVHRAKQRARQQALFNCITLSLFCGVLASVSSWKPVFLYLGRVWSVINVGDQVKAYTELVTEALAWGVLLTMGWPWNLLIYPSHLTRTEFTNARKESRSPSFENIRTSVYNPFAKKHPPPKLT